MNRSASEWDGICACGKAEADGKRCKLGATHEAPARERDEEPDLSFLGEDDA